MAARVELAMNIVDDRHLFWRRHKDAAHEEAARAEKTRPPPIGRAFLCRNGESPDRQIAGKTAGERIAALPECLTIGQNIELRFHRSIFALNNTFLFYGPYFFFSFQQIHTKKRSDS